MSEQSHVKKENDPMISKFQESIMKFEDLNRKVKDFGGSLDSLTDKVDNIHQDHQKHKQMILGEYSKQSSLIGGLSLSQDIHKEFTEGNKTAIKEIQKHLGTHSQTQDMLRIQIENLESKQQGYVKEISFHLLQDQFQHLIKNFNDSQSKLSDSHNDIKNQQGQISKSNVDISQSLSELKSKIDDLDVRQGANSRRLDLFKDSVDRDIDHHKVYTTKFIDEKISSIPSPKMPDNSSQIIDLKSQFEGARLDAANSKLRSENSEKKIQILERKIEQLQLLIDKQKLGS